MVHTFLGKYGSNLLEPVCELVPATGEKLHVRVRLFEFARKNRTKNAQLLRWKPQVFQILNKILIAAHSKHSTQIPRRHTKKSRYCSQTKNKRRMEPAATVTSEATPSCCYDFSSSSPPAGEEFVVIDGPLPAGLQPLFDFNSSSSSSSSAPAAQTGLIIVDGPSPADGLGCQASAATVEISPDSVHTHLDAPSSVCTGTGYTGSSSDESAEGTPIFQISAHVLCATTTS